MKTSIDNIIPKFKEIPLPYYKEIEKDKQEVLNREEFFPTQSQLSHLLQY